MADINPDIIIEGRKASDMDLIQNIPADYLITVANPQTGKMGIIPYGEFAALVNGIFGDPISPSDEVDEPTTPVIKFLNEVGVYENILDENGDPIEKESDASIVWVQWNTAGEHWVKHSTTMNLTNYAQKSATSPILTTTDADGRSPFAVCEDGSLYYAGMGVEEEKIIYTPDALFSEVDAAGNVIRATLNDGSQYPVTVEHDEITKLAIASQYSAKSEVPFSDVVSNSFWSHWIGTLAALDNAGDLYISSVGNGRGRNGELWLTKRYTDGRTVTKLAGRVRTTANETDDHNAMCILMDPRYNPNDLENIVGTANAGTVPDTLASNAAYYISGNGTYTNFLSAASTPIVITSSDNSYMILRFNTETGFWTKVRLYYPIILFQCEHTTHKMRMCRLTSLDPAAWVFNWDDTKFGNINGSYPQAFRNGDEILLFWRAETAPAGSASSTRTERCSRSTDNGDTFTSKNLFWKSDEHWPYILFKEKSDGSGLNIAINSHPKGNNTYPSTDKGIYFLELIWSTGAIRNPATGNVVDNFRTDIFSNGSWTGINPFSGGIALELYVAAGTKRKRMWDVGRSVNGNCLVLYTEVPDDGNSMATFMVAKTKAISFNINTGAINWDAEIGDAGMPNERPVEANLYFSGAAIINNTLVCSLVHRNQSMLEGGNNTTDSNGLSTGYLIDITNHTTPVTREFVRSSGKLMRPIVTKGSEYLLYCEADNYLTYNGSDIISSVIVENISKLIEL